MIIALVGSEGTLYQIVYLCIFFLFYIKITQRNASYIYCCLKSRIKVPSPEAKSFPMLKEDKLVSFLRCFERPGGSFICNAVCNWY